MAVGSVWAAAFLVLLVHTLLPRAGIAPGHRGMATRYEYSNALDYYLSNNSLTSTHVPMELL